MKILTKKGFTLVETIVAIVIAIIVIVAVSAFLIFGLNIMGNTVNHADNQQVADMASDFIRDQLQYAKSIEVVTSSSMELPTPSSGQALLYIGTSDATSLAKEGYVFYKRASDSNPARNVFGSDFYGQTKIALDYKATVQATDLKKVVDINVLTYRDEKQVYRVKHAFKLVNSEEGDSPTSFSESLHSNETYYLLIEE
ncbi:MAG: prepilin-type N-terminal cleavage/methylation domain-containing protein [Clostridiales Family XIII bacterium]|nr:prepilin-type N-terminal cleavage/methylation domain-containing protein [Clostridiales Family XIII bacterium]